jgi:hypothetical protein
METQQLSLFAGTISTTVFAASNVPMLYKAFKTGDLRSYSLTMLVLNNLGNGVHWLYIVALPVGPIWFMHGFYTISTAIMLICYLRQHADAPKTA